MAQFQATTASAMGQVQADYADISSLSRSTVRPKPTIQQVDGVKAVTTLVNTNDDQVPADFAAATTGGTFLFDWD